MEEVQFRELTAEELTPRLFGAFRRRQQVERCWRKAEGRWELRDIPFLEDWDAGDHARLCGRLAWMLAQGGKAWGAFARGELKGFASVDGRRIGSQKQYAVLEELHVSEERRGQGLGRRLFTLAAGFARELGAEKLYISAMSAEESQAFYRAMGCVEAQEYDPFHVEKEPCDVQMEYPL